MESRAPQCRADIEVTCFTYEGIDAIRDALLTGCDAGTAECPIRIKLIAPPMYVMTTMTLDKDLGIAALQAGIDAITAKIQVRAGAVALVALAAASFRRRAGGLWTTSSSGSPTDVKKVCEV